MTKPKPNTVPSGTNGTSGFSESRSGNASSPALPTPTGPWTDAEMRSAQPMPLPTVDPTMPPAAVGVPHAGKGRTSPAGPPAEEDKNKAP